jgi:hypothetical protein
VWLQSSSRAKCFPANPDHYLRYNKSFNRMDGEMRYMTADNRDFLLALIKGLEERK